MKDKNHTRKQTEIHDPYIKVGRISVPIARKAHIKAADIYVSKNQLKHIWNVHGNLGSEDSRTPEVFDCPEVGFNMGAAREALRQR